MNPGYRMLYNRCGFVMHTGQPGHANGLRQGPEALLEGYRIAKKRGEVMNFFKEAFDKTQNPCVEGRMTLILK